MENLLQKKGVIMKMLRHYFISDNLDDLELFEEQLEDAGVSTPQIHVLSQHDGDVAQHNHLHAVTSFMKNDIVHSTTRGAIIGLFVFTLVLSVAYLANWTQSPAGWLPFVFLAVVMLGFCTWQGGLVGIQLPNHQFRRFEEALKDDKHIFFVDIEPSQEAILEKILQSHPQVQLAGTGTSAPYWFIEWQKRVPRFFKETWP